MILAAVTVITVLLLIRCIHLEAELNEHRRGRR